MISRKLLSEVFNEKVLSYNVINKTEIIVQFFEYDEVINIYELAHKCKEWAVKNNRENKDNIDEHFYINDICSQFIGYVEKWQCIVGYRGNKDMRFGTEYETHWSDMNITFEADTEPEAIFKATSYIMEQLKQND